MASGVIVARALGAQDRGYLALLVVISGICTFLGSLGIFSAVTFYVARDHNAARPIMRSLRNPALVQVAATAVFQAIVLFAIVASDPRRVQVAAVISLLITPGIFAYGYGEALLLGQQRFTAFNIFRAIPTTAYAALVLAAAVAGAANIVVVMMIWAGANFVAGILTLVVALRGLPKTESTGPLPSREEMASFGLKSLLGAASPIETFRADQAVVGLFLTPVALGLYVAAQAFTNLSRTAAQSIGYIAYPRVAASADRAEARAKVWKFFFAGVAVTGCMTAVLVVGADKLIGTFFGSDFAGAVPIARILLIGTFFAAARRVLTDSLRGLGYPGIGTIAEVSGWIMLVPLFVVLLPHGATGIALALAIAWAFSLGVAIMFAVAEGTPIFDLPLSSMRGNALLVGVSLAIVGAGGAAASTLSLKTTLGLVILALGVLFFGYSRSTLRRKLDDATGPSAQAAAALAPRRPPPQPPDLRLPRNIYYAGVVLLALLTVRASGQVTFSDLLFLLALGLACAELIIIRRTVPITLPMTLLGGIVIFTLGGVASSFESYAAFKSMATVGRLIFLTIFWFWCGTVVLRTRAQVRKAVSLWVTSAAICGLGAIIQLGVGDVIPNTHMVFGRSTGFTGQPNDLGGLCAIAFVPAVMLSTRRGLSPTRRFFSYVALLYVTAGLVLSGSVGAMIAAVAAVFVWFALQKSSKGTLMPFGVMIAAVLALTAFQAARGAQTPLSRFHHVTAQGEGPQGAGSVDERIQTYRVAEAGIKRDPFVGVGLDLISVTKPFGVVSYQYDVHNLVIGTWYKAGVFGLIGMLMVVWALMRVGWRATIEARDESEQLLVASLLAGFVGFVVFAMGAPVLFTRYGWVPAAFLLALRAVQLREGGARQPAEPEVLTPTLRPIPVTASEFGR